MSQFRVKPINHANTKEYAWMFLKELLLAIVQLIILANFAKVCMYKHIQHSAKIHVCLDLSNGNVHKIAISIYTYMYAYMQTYTHIYMRRS